MDEQQVYYRPIPASRKAASNDRATSTAPAEMQDIVDYGVEREESWR